MYLVKSPSRLSSSQILASVIATLSVISKTRFCFSIGSTWWHQGRSKKISLSVIWRVGLPGVLTSFLGWECREWYWRSWWLHHGSEIYCCCRSLFGICWHQFGQQSHLERNEYGLFQWLDWWRLVWIIRVIGCCHWQAVITLYEQKDRLSPQAQEALYRHPIETILALPAPQMQQWVIRGHKYYNQQLKAAKKQASLQTEDIRQFFGPPTLQSDDLHPP